MNAFKRTSEKYQTELFLGLNSDGSFSQWARGRMAPVDRFLSNFHKPLQRRMLFTDPAKELPATGVIKSSATGEIFLVGSSRNDVSNDEEFERLSVLHVVSNSSSGLVEYFNYDQTAITPLVSDPINIGKTSEGNIYVALEYKSAKSSEFGDEAYQGNYLVYSQKTTGFARDGIFTLNGRNYKVTERFIDSDFSCATVIEQDDDMQPITYHEIDDATSGYNVTTGALTTNVVDYILPGTVDRTMQDVSGGKNFEVYIKLAAPPVAIRAGNNITLADGSLAEIMSVVQDTNTQGQIKLLCSGG